MVSLMTVWLTPSCHTGGSRVRCLRGLFPTTIFARLFQAFAHILGCGFIHCSDVVIARASTFIDRQHTVALACLINAKKVYWSASLILNGIFREQFHQRIVFT